MELTKTGEFGHKTLKSPGGNSEEDSLSEDEMRDTIVRFDKIGLARTERTVSQLDGTEKKNDPNVNAADAWKLPDSLLS
jgi:hypothetical protein